MLMPVLALCIVFVILIAGVAFKVFKIVFKIISIIFVLLFVVALVCGFLVYQDINDMKQNFAEKNNMLILHNQDRFLTAFELNLKDMQKLDESALKYLSANMMKQTSDYLKSKELDKILGSNYKELIIDYSAFENVKEIEVKDDKYSNEFTLAVLESDDPKETIKNELQKRGRSTKSISTTENIKELIFTQLLSKKIEQDTPLFLISEIKKKNIMVYPETITIMIMKLMPTEYVTKVVKERLISSN